MARTHPLECDNCEKSMLFRREIKDQVQSYRCFSCPDRWAIVYLNYQGGVSSIEYTNGSYKRKVMLALGTAGLVGDLIRNRK